MTPPPVVTGREESIDAIYGALLHRAHVEGLYGMQVTLLQAPTDENGQTALVRAEVHTVQGVFSAIGEAGDADAGNTSGLCGTAELRAKVRALQDALDAPAAALHPPVTEGPVEARPSLWAIVRDERAACGVALSPPRPRLDVLPGGLR